MRYDGFGYGGGLLMLLMVLFWLALIVLIVWLVVKLWPGAGRAQAGPPAAPPSAVSPAETPEQALDRMFALGEIDEATYRSRRTTLAEMKQRP